MHRRWIEPQAISVSSPCFNHRLLQSYLAQWRIHVSKPGAASWKLPSLSSCFSRHLFSLPQYHCVFLSLTLAEPGVLQHFLLLRNPSCTHAAQRLTGKWCWAPGASLYLHWRVCSAGNWLLAANWEPCNLLLPLTSGRSESHSSLPIRQENQAPLCLVTWDNALPSVTNNLLPCGPRWLRVYKIYQQNQYRVYRIN